MSFEWSILTRAFQADDSKDEDEDDKSEDKGDGEEKEEEAEDGDGDEDEAEDEDEEDDEEEIVDPKEQLEEGQLRPHDAALRRSGPPMPFLKGPAKFTVSLAFWSLLH